MPRSLRKQLSAWLALVLSLHLALASSIAWAQAQPKSGAAKPKPGAAAAAPADLVAKGQELFDDQQYEESIQTLSAALLRPSNTKEQKVEIYRLLALNYITLGRKDEADNAVRGLLVVRPDYELPESESPKFRDFFKEAREKWEAEGRPGLGKETGPERQVTIRHNTPASAEPDKTIVLKASLDDPNKRHASVKFYYRTGSKGEFTEGPTELEDENETVKVKVPGSAVKPPLLDYYFEVLDAKGSVIAQRGDSMAPLRIAIEGTNAGGGTGWVLPVAIGGGILAAAAVVGGLALAGVFKSSSPPPTGGRRDSTVTINVGEAGLRF